METSQRNDASPSSSSIPSKFKYDVFLSFRGLDTRKSYTSHLLAALEQHGFHTFRDDTKLNRGEYIGDELLKAIEDSRISLVVLSKNYAASRWCLEELVKIMECRKTLQQIVMPIFYDVEPSDVRAQQGSLAEAFANHEKEHSDVTVKKWRKALTKVANLSSWDVPYVANGDEANSIRKVVGEVWNKLTHGSLNVAYHEIGLESRLQKLISLLDMDSNCVRIVAIWGMGGIGKTTIAKKLYNHIQHQFEGSSFLANVREISNQPNGLVILQEKLLSDILKGGSHPLSTSDQGIEVIKRRAFCRKVLLILDDVDCVQQLKALAIDRDSFGFGSRIIITTRDISSVNWLKVDETYAAEELNDDESLKLFRWYCFKEVHLTQDHLDLSTQVVKRVGGLPLALEVLGTFLCGKNIPQWISAVAKLTKIPHDDVQGILRISIDSLSKEVKELFLDMACFFVGRNRDFTVKILEGCNFSAEIGIQVLADRCLIKYDCGQIAMHDVLIDMGREIVRQECEDPGKRSRLWYIDDVLDVLRGAMGTVAVKGLVKATDVQVNAQPSNRLLYRENAFQVTRDGMGTKAVKDCHQCHLNFTNPIGEQVNGKAFERMNNLWLLHLDYVHITAGYEHISKRLLWLSWKGFPLQSVPWNFSIEKLVALDLCYGHLKRVWDGKKVLDKLKFLYLGHCHYLTETPDFSGLKNLKELFLNDCTRLVKVSESIGHLNKLLVLDLKNCKRLRKVPSSIWTLKTLESLDLSGCSMLENTFGFKGWLSKYMFSSFSSWIFKTKGVESIVLSPSHVLGLGCLKELRMKNCNLSYLPNEVGNLISLETLDLSYNNLGTLPDRFCNLTRLKILEMIDCNLSHLPNEVGNLIWLESLSLQENNLHTLPDSICNLTRLKDLKLYMCNLSHLPSEFGRLILLEQLDLALNNLVTLPDSFCNLACLGVLNLNGCKLSHLPDRIGMLRSLCFLCLKGNNYLRSLPNSCSDLASLQILGLEGCRRLQSLPQLPVNLGVLNARDCTSLESIPLEFNWQARLWWFLGGCSMLAKNNFANNLIQRIGQSYSDISTCVEWKLSPPNGENREINIYLPGDEVPNWFKYKSTGSRLSLVEPRTIRGMFICIVFRINVIDESAFYCLPISVSTPPLSTWLSVKNPRSPGEDLILISYVPLDSFYYKALSGAWCRYTRGIYCGDGLEIVINPINSPQFMVKKCGINFIYEGDECNTDMPGKKRKRN